MSEKTKIAINFGIMYIGLIAMIGSIAYNLFFY